MTRVWCSMRVAFRLHISPSGIGTMCVLVTASSELQLVAIYLYEYDMVNYRITELLRRTVGYIGVMHRPFKKCLYITLWTEWQ